MKKSLAVLALVTASAVLGMGSHASADPVHAGLFGPFNLALQGLHDDPAATAAQKSAVEAAQALFTASTATKLSQELTLIEKMFKPLDKAFKGNVAYQTAADGLITVMYGATTGSLPQAAFLAAGSHGLAIVGVSKKITALTKKLDPDHDGVAEAEDRTRNRAKFRKSLLAFTKYCEGVIKKYGGV